MELDSIKRHSNMSIFRKILAFAVISFIAAFVLSVDAIKLAENPAASLSCNLNSFLSCGTVALSWQASVFGFPNSFLGLIFEPMVIVMSVLGMAGTKFPRWFAITEQYIYGFASLFAIWLFTQSMFVIGALCPWCLVITYVTPLIFIELMHYNIKEKNFFPKNTRTQDFLTKLLNWRIDQLVSILWVLGVTILVLVNYGPYLFN